MTILPKEVFVWEKKRSALIQTLLYCGEECELVWPLWRIVRRFLKKLKLELSYGTAIPLLGINPEKT